MTNLLTFSDETSVPTDQKVVLLFTAEWHDAHAKCLELLKVLCEAHTSIVFATCAAEDCPHLTQAYAVQSVPTFVLIDNNNNNAVVERIVGDHPALLTQAVAKLAQMKKNDTSTDVALPTTTARPEGENSLTRQLDNLIKSSDVMVFMKGTPSAPRCGFSRQLVEILDANHIPFGSFDILTNEEIRQGLKNHSDWPTYPQLYVHGELIGGLDIVKEMNHEGNLAGQFNLPTMASSSPQSLNDRLKQIVNQSKIMLFMKGLPSSPCCGFSRQIVEILDSYKVDYEAFDILTDEEVRQGLKTYSDWPTYPQLYVQGELIGGLDIVREMHEDGSLKDALVQ